jgi:hypothetical protein
MDTIKNVLTNVKNTVTDKFNGNTPLLDLPDIERSVSDLSVTLGAEYDARKDSYEGVFNGDTRSKKEKINEKASAIMYKGETIKIENLLKILQIDDETRLATVLKLIRPDGILSIVNYSYLIDDLTRLIYYSEPIEEESLISDFRKHKHWSKSSTHLVSKIKLGISLVIMLQLSHQDSSLITKIDKSLECFTSHLGSDLDIENIIPNEEQFLKNILKTKIYSNINDLTRLSNICEVYKQIQKIKQDPRQYRPLSFILSPIPHSDSSKNVYIQINNEYATRVEKFMLLLSFNIKMLKNELKILKSSLLTNYLQQKLDHADQLFIEFKDFYSTQLEKFKNSVIQIRSEEMPQVTLVQLLDTEEQKLLLKKRDDIIKYFDDLKSKNALILELQKERIDYLNISDTDVNQDDDRQTLEDKLIKNDRNIRIFCSNDHLRSENNDQWNELIEKLIEFRTDKKNFRLVYADFSYSSYQLEELKILNSPKSEKKKKVIGGPSKVNSNKTPPKTESTINIVLFGESGVGKSTFINAFANYLLFENIDQARSDEPVVVIPVSFVMTINDQFDERHIQFGRIHSNENHNNLGQSVTQKCKSYELTSHDGKMLKIIDTPGFGDTRGQDQDEKNLNEIFSYIQSLTHLNALCILLKPNVKELNPSFKSSFRQILHVLGDQFYKNIFFCFTNSQSTFFTLGDTGPELNKFLQSYQMNLKKENTFCFDSESFRYLVASQDNIKFDEHFIDQFEQSWLKSVKESKRFVNQIYLREIQKNIEQKWISIQQIKRDIIHLIRPVLEALRNISRNIILSDNESFKRSIQLISIPLDSPRSICYKFDRSYKTFGEFYIMLDYFHESSDQCENEHLTTNYELHYQFVEKKTDYSADDANDYQYGIVKACANFDYFLKNNDQANKDEPFLSGINRMVNEEKSICEREQSHHRNKKLHRRLEKLKEQYNKDLQAINSTDECLYLTSICSRIEGIKQMPMIYEQLNLNQQQTDHRE